MTRWQGEEDSKVLLCDKCDMAISCVFCRDLHLTLLCFLFFFIKRSLQRKVKFGGNHFQTKLLSCLSHKVFHHPSFPVLLNKFTNINVIVTNIKNKN